MIGRISIAAAALAYGSAAVGSSTSVPPVKHWSIDDIATTPVVTDILLTNGRQSIAYVVRAADVAQNAMVSTLWIADINGRKRRLLRSSSIEQLRKIPGSSDWSVLADLGAGIQLYRVTTKGRATPIAAHDPAVGFGNSDHSVHSIIYDAPKKIGISSYGWSPDGRWLWYAVLKEMPDKREVRFDEAITPEFNVRRPPIDAEVEYHLRDQEGQDRIIARRPVSDRIALYFGGNISWGPSALRYEMENVAKDGQSRFVSASVDLASGVTKDLPDPPSSPFLPPPVGPRGGRLITVGFGQSRQLFEELESGRRIAYGRAGFLLDDLRAAGSWRSVDGRMSLIGVRTINRPRYALLRVDEHSARLIDDPNSFTKCDFAADLSVGACVREGLAKAPELVLVRPKERRITVIAPVSERHSAITPLRITAKEWTNKLGYFASGFVVWPRDYVAGRRYPAIVITHGSDADERFARQDIQWNYPAQIFAEEGYVVLLINDPAPSQSSLLSKAYEQWSTGTGNLVPDEMQKLIWFNSIYSYEVAIQNLVAVGIVDPKRVGIAGFSRGAQLADVAITRSCVFSAASSGDGSYLEPYAYSWMQQSYNAIFGGSPFGPALSKYKEISLSLRANDASGPVLRQLATPLAGAIDIYRALRAADVPSQVSFYPGESPISDETHLFHVPTNRIEAMGENLAWFDFWLRGRRSAEMPFPARYATWDAMARSWPGQALKPNHCSSPTRSQ
ncbi:dipeptidyl aminopeptidase/acylaminoacyl peptidase [Hephaestia caeni]|uniref:Dipeptidyl aminopeptidase/acylaminoacyl peptidase n=1 Tax=Hephaestia caeni TaxID=645617 RepID=A0A397PHN2_9SPHN|nr:dipeptidyl aminopeptidase/acylaminoacyl peptidase [Hephaestia caeni]